MSNPKDSKVALRAGAPLLGIMPRDIDEVWRLASMAKKSGLLKRLQIKTRVEDDKGNSKFEYVEEDDEALMARAAMQICQGLEIGMPPMQSLQLIALVGNRLVVHSEGVPAILWAKGFKLREWEEDEYTDNWTAHCELTRPDGTVIARKFSVKQAIKAKLWSPAEKITKKGRGGSTYEAENDSAWHRFDFRMLLHRARGYAANDGGADAMRGVGVRELVEDGRTIDITPNSRAALEVPNDIPDEAEPVVSEAEDNQDSPLAKPEAYLVLLGENLAGAESETAFDEVWRGYEALVEAGRVADEHQRQAEALYKMHGKRFGIEA